MTDIPTGGSNYPPGAENDPNAPYNEKDSPEENDVFNDCVICGAEINTTRDPCTWSFGLTSPICWDCSCHIRDQVEEIEISRGNAFKV